MPEGETETSALRLMVRSAIHQAVFETEDPVDAEAVATQTIMGFIDSVHQNAVGYGRMLGEEVVLEAALAGCPRPALEHWYEATLTKLREAGREA